MKRFLFYDIETSGLNPAFDQVLTFACIQTDTDLNELSRETITVKLRPDIVPSPGAFLTHGLTPEELEQGIPEYQAAVKIHRLFNTPNTVSIGYNSLGFDDEFLRFLFYRNLLDPYSHQYANGCSRMDLLPVAAIYRLFCDRVLSWPVREDGRQTLKLEYLSRENRFEVSGRAHEAMADVEALLGLARAFSKEKKVWEYVTGFFDKKREHQRIEGLKQAKTGRDIPFLIGLMVSVSFGPESNYMAPVLHLGGSVPYKNQELWVRLDNEDLFASTDDESGIYDFFVIRKRPGDQWFILPCLDRFRARLIPDAVAAWEKNMGIIRDNRDLFMKTVDHYRGYKYPDIPGIDSDADLYQGGFFTPGEKREIASFHMADRENKAKACTALKSARVKTLAERILIRSFDYSPKKGGEFAAHLQRLSGQKDCGDVVGYKNELKLDCVRALAEVAEFESAGNLNPDQEKMLGWLKSHIQGLSSFFAEAF